MLTVRDDDLCGSSDKSRKSSIQRQRRFALDQAAGYVINAVMGVSVDGIHQNRAAQRPMVSVSLSIDVSAGRELEVSKDQLS